MDIPEIINQLYANILSFGNTHKYTNFPFPKDSKLIRSAAKEMESFIKPTDPFYFVGHRLGNFQHYPKNINNPKYIPTYKNTIELMEYGFLKNGLNALEFDVRLGHDENIYITHDELTITPESPCWEYLKKNTLNIFLTHFIKNKYYLNQKLFIEIKVSPKVIDTLGSNYFPDILTDKEKKLIDSTLLVIDSIVYNYPEEKSLILKSISFLSFSLSALRYATQSSQNNQESYLITTTNQPFKKDLSPLFNYTPFIGKEIERIRHAEWLTGIWYDPFHLDNSIDLFSNLNAFRANKLKFYISTYGMNFEELVNKLSKEPHNEKLPVSGIIYDVS
jgi:glycerophosphoryl diester phosphodiesterase